jgi:hypothetical protein
MSGRVAGKNGSWCPRKRLLQSVLTIQVRSVERTRQEAQKNRHTGKVVGRSLTGLTHINRWDAGGETPARWKTLVHCTYILGGMWDNKDVTPTQTFVGPCSGLDWDNLFNKSVVDSHWRMGGRLAIRLCIVLEYQSMGDRVLTTTLIDLPIKNGIMVTKGRLWESFVK